MQITKDAKQYLFEGLPENVAEFMNDVRMGRREFHEVEDIIDEE